MRTSLAWVFGVAVLWAAGCGGGDGATARDGGGDGATARDGGGDGATARDGGGGGATARDGGSDGATPRDGGGDGATPRDGGGSDGATGRDGGSVRTCGGSGGASCAATEYCDYAVGCGARGERGICRPRPGDCPAVDAPVCGCEGRTYPNECEAHRSGTDVAHPGACDSDSDCRRTGCGMGLRCCALTGRCYDPRCLSCCMPVPR